MFIGRMLPYPNDNKNKLSYKIIPFIWCYVAEKQLI